MVPWFMAKTSVVPKKKRGPAPTGKGVQVGERWHPSELAAIDAWIAASSDKTLTRAHAIRRLVEARAEGKKQMIKPKRSAEQQVADELERRALHPLSSRQTISDSQAEPEFHANHKRLRAERLAREAVEMGLKVKK